MKLKLLTVKAGKPPVKFYTITQAAEACGRTKHTFLQYEKKGYMPGPNYKLPCEKHGGYRLYSERLVEELKIIFLGIRQGRKITQQQIGSIYAAFNDELKYYQNEY
jgi:DNA-binding transcriptional MerR regulator